MASRAIQKLFVGNLNWTTSHRELKNYFAEFGRVVRAEVVFDKTTGLSKGYGFVQVPIASLKAITSKDTHHLEGKRLNVDKAHRGPA